jgi:uncharacterized protein (DUF488 family)
MTERTLYTVGSSDRSEEQFIDLLRGNSVTTLLDVRSKNGSRVLHFDESRFKNLSRMLARHGLGYDLSLHIALGGLQDGKMTVGNFRRYSRTPEFRSALDELKTKVAANAGSTVILCCERDPKQCHRKVIGDVLESEGWRIVHLV